MRNSAESRLAGPRLNQRRGTAGGLWAVVLLLPCLVDARSANPASEAFECYLKPSAEVEVGSPIEGVIDVVEVDRGDTVGAGQVVARLRSGVEAASVELARLRSVSQTEVKSAEARVELAGSEYQRRRELSDKSFASATEVEIARTEHVLAKLALAAAREQQQIAAVELQRAKEVLERRVVRSPFDGVVVGRYHDTGDLIERAPILRLAKINPVHVEVVLPAARLQSVARGDEADVFPEFPVDSRYRARVDVVDRIVDAASGTFRVRLAIPNPDGTVTPGLQCTVHFPRPAAAE